MLLLSLRFFLQGFRDQNTGPKNVSVEVLLDSKTRAINQKEQTSPKKHFRHCNNKTTFSA